MAASTHTTEHDIQVAPELAELHLEERPDGPAAAAVLAAGIGILVLGLMTTGAVIWSDLKEFLVDFEGDRGVGALAGKSTVAVLAWAISWAVLAIVWRGQDVDLRRYFGIALVLGLIGVVLTFPPVFEAFE